MRKKKSIWQIYGERVGRPCSFESPEELWEACCQYFQWVEANPIREQKIFSSGGKIVRRSLSKMRAMTQVSMCRYIGISQETWNQYRTRDGFSEVTGAVDDIIYAQKFEGAAAGLLNSNLIARDLGLKEKQEVAHSGGVTIQRVMFSEDDNAG